MPLRRVLELTKKQEGNKTMKLLEDWTAALTTNCECSYLDEEDNEVMADYCQGWCYEDANDNAIELIEEWLERNDHPSALIIRGVAMGWQRLSGYALIRESSDKIASETLDKLKLNGDFTLELKLTGRACHVVRYSHDEPTGASFELEAFTACDGWSECQATEGIREYEGVNLCAYCHEIEEAN
jgi:hypothetical protein